MSPSMKSGLVRLSAGTTFSRRFGLFTAGYLSHHSSQRD